MKKLILMLVIILHLNLNVDAETKKILFIGNSLTFVNDVPKMFANIANSFGDSTETTMYAVAGAGFRNHINDTELLNLLRNKANYWDFIVLQPGTDESGGELYGGPNKMKTLDNIKYLLNYIEACCPCAQILFYEVSNGIKGNSESDINDYNEIMKHIYDNTNFFAEQTNSSLVPVGEALKKVWNTNPNSTLWSDPIHPNVKGSYLAACVFYASIYKKKSVGTSFVANLPESEYKYLQNIADSIVLSGLNYWKLDELHTNNFDLKESGYLEYSFLCEASFYDSLEWDFGDGINSEDINPIHKYNSKNNYIVKLTTWKNGCSLFTDKSIIMITDDIKNKEKCDNKLYIYPNPSADYIFIKGMNESVNYYIYSASGKLLLNGKGLSINVCELKSSIYYICLEYNNFLHKFSFIKG